MGRPCPSDGARDRQEMAHRVPVNPRWDPRRVPEFAANARTKKLACGTGVAAYQCFDPVHLAVRRNRRSAAAELADYTPAHHTQATQWQLCGGLQAIGSDPCLGEHVTLDVVRNGLRVSLRFLGLTVAVEVIRSKPLQRHMRPPAVVPALEFGARGREVIKPFDDRYATEQLVLERLDDPLGHSDRSLLSYSSQARFERWRRSQFSGQYSLGWGQRHFARVIEAGVHEIAVSASEPSVGHLHC